MSTGLAIVNNIIDFLSSVSSKLGLDILFIIGMVVEVLFVLFFLFKASFSYEVSLNRALDKINYWLFQKKVVNEDNIRELNEIFKTKAPKKLCYYWHQYVLFREGVPSTYFTAENLIEQPVKTSSYSSDVKNLRVLTILWAVLCGTFIFISQSLEASAITGAALVMALLLGLIVSLIGFLVVIFMRTRQKSILNTLYQNVRLLDRFMDNACVDLASYVDYQILFTPSEIEKGQPVLREFLDFKARKEKEEFNKAREEEIDYTKYDFTETGVDGSIVLSRAMRESELFIKRRDKILVQISQLEAELESRRKNFDNVQRDSQTKLQASKENIARLRQMQEETTNRIESNYYRKQQTQEAAKQEQLEQEFDQQRAKYLLEKSECEEEIKKLNEELENYRKRVEDAMLGEYKTFYEKFCTSAEKVVERVFAEKLSDLKNENENYKQKITDLEVKIKNGNFAEETPAENTDATEQEGHYDEHGNYVYENGTFYDPDGNFHDNDGKVYDQNGNLLSKPEEKYVVDLDNFDTFDFMTDVKQKDDIYDVAEDVVKALDKDNEFEVSHTETKPEEVEETEEDDVVEEEPVVAENKEEQLESFNLDEEEKVEDEKPVEEETEETVEEVVEEEPVVEEKPRRKAGRPKKIVKQEETVEKKKKVGRPRKTAVAEEEKPKKKVGRPRKVAKPVETEDKPKRKVGRPKKVTKVAEPKKRVGRPRKTVKAEEKPVETKRRVGRPKKVVKVEEPKRKVGRPRKTQTETISDINRRLSEEEARLAQMREDLSREFELAMNGANENSSQRKRNQIMREIESLQSEAENLVASNQSEAKMQEINEKLERLLDEIKKING